AGVRQGRAPADAVAFAGTARGAGDRAAEEGLAAAVDARQPFADRPAVHVRGARVGGNVGAPDAGAGLAADSLAVAIRVGRAGLIPSIDASRGRGVARRAP